MQLLDFRDTCVITRERGEKDEWDNTLAPQVVYDGACSYQEGGTSYTRVFTMRSPTVFLPGVDVEVRINDALAITTEFGREIKSIAKIVRDVNLPWRAGIKVTRIELKQAQGD
jgi:hypothetical protein